ncbi:MAG TPA: glutamate-5-semialdehyde dehydrogenase [Spirochaetota bacterium]|jgi:glutamate-5-semialdehyde dehydrogenase|nr:glutamate-5-semialdehyde dehydrogenase [Spirochaetota bacterium]HOA07436.1 glutamate-5-semialdehyde dehydrogenase [Spirochaetota bacterium]HOH37338.1 glutamate-5-semialdehyde dehydrogenase [Spirochaetota bacterium]HPJ13662.1 glutamate-5-semialdehyde dehydrogenase [Spirochaetota bacterium]HPM33458.1 glutamate-5-semialdehyde dehydrogenase [Spirochaetota bacterium]
MDKTAYVSDICSRAKKSSKEISLLGEKKKNEMLLSLSSALRKEKDYIIEENSKDLIFAKDSGLSSAMIDRLSLDEKRIDSLAKSVEFIVSLANPVGSVENMKTMPSGIRVGQMRVPVGVVMVIYEARPNVTVDIASLCLKSGNVAVLRGGKEAINSNKALYSIAKKVFSQHVSSEPLFLVDDLDYAVVDLLLKQNRYIDIVIPRGGEKLIKTVSEKSLIPVIKHDKGLCHLFIDESAEKQMAIDIAVNGKVQRPGVCNAVETILIHRKFPYTAELLSALKDKNVEIRGDEFLRSIESGVKLASSDDYDTEYLDLICSAKTVDSIDEAIDHIASHSSNHSEAIVTNNYFNAERFINEVDSSAVLVNASTRFHDGGEFGLGAEVGISTQKLHARGAMGMQGLTCLKYIVYGTGQIRS